MKIRHLLVIVPLILGCQDETGPTNPQIVGTWSWIESRGGFVGDHITPQSGGYTKKVRFTLSGAYLRYRNDAVERQARYRMEQKKIGEWGSFDVLKVDGERTESIVSFRTRDTLKLSEYCADCWEYTYVRIGE